LNPIIRADNVGWPARLSVGPTIGRVADFSKFLVSLFDRGENSLILLSQTSAATDG
jgi:hypothetical protein